MSGRGCAKVRRKDVNKFKLKKGVGGSNKDRLNRSVRDRSVRDRRESAVKRKRRGAGHRRSKSCWMSWL